MISSPIALYIHWPFCLHKCPYCDFNSHVREGVIDQKPWAAAYCREFDSYAERLGTRRITSIFFGGGTPSLMEGETVASILRHVAARWEFAPDIEITLEANPTSAEARKFKEFRAAGVNRVSIGIQSLRQADLAFLGRQHNVAEALDALAAARKIFPRVSFDLIYARPQQTLPEWETELREALAHTDGHLSLYQLTIEKGTPFYSDHQRKKWAIPRDDLAAAMYECTGEVLEDAGMQAYEISNYAKPGQESRHNLNYWRYGEYLGLGPGAHGRIIAPGGRLLLQEGRTATMAIHHPERWLAAVEEHGTGLQQSEEISGEALLAEMFMMGTRLSEGIPRSRFRELLGADPEVLLDARKLDLFQKEGLLTLDDRVLVLTARGRMLHQSVVAGLL